MLLRMGWSCRIPACKCIAPQTVPGLQSTPTAGHAPPGDPQGGPLGPSWQVGLEGLNQQEEASLWLGLQGVADSFRKPVGSCPAGRELPGRPCMDDDAASQAACRAARASLLHA